jgi:ABC-type multidrug transport system permease subunit
MKDSAPLYQLTVARFREFYREPAAVFWVYGFPIIMAVALGIAFRERPVEKLTIDIVADANATQAAAELQSKLAADARLQVKAGGDDWKKRLRSGKTDLVIIVHVGLDGAHFEMWDEPNRTESVLARNEAENVMLTRSGAKSLPIEDHQLKETGSRYIDFLIPGLLGMNLMGGGLFGVGFVIVDMRVRKLLKRYLATPMRRSDFMLAIMISRMVFLLPEVLLILLFGYLAFDVKVQGSVIELFIVIVLGAACFAGVGLLLACRAKTIETVSGLMNLMMLPMYVLSGVFFSSERFPEAMQPFIKALPLTALNDAIRGIMLEGQSLPALWSPLLILIAWGVVSFAIALRYFRWK